MSARAIESRCFCPPEIFVGFVVLLRATISWMLFSWDSCFLLLLSTSCFCVNTT